MGRCQLRNIPGENHDQLLRQSNEPLDLSHVVSDGPSSFLGVEWLTYNGVTKLAAPTARPTTLLPSIMPHTWPVTACIKAPRVNRTSATSITLRRPSLSANIPAKGLANKAKRLVQDVIRLLSRVVRTRSDRSEPIDTRVEEMTPVLYRTYMSVRLLRGFS